MGKRTYLLHTARIGVLFLMCATLGGSTLRADTPGESLFKAKCAGCHGADGKGETAMGKTMKLRDLASADVQKQSGADLTTIISAGKNKMPAYGKSLSADQIKALVDYLRALAKK